MRYYAPFDGTRGSEPSMVARAREIHGARSLVGPAGTRTMAADRPGGAFGTLRSGHAVPQSALSSAPFDPGVVSILPFARLGCPNRRGTVPDSSMLVLKFASNLT